MSTLPELLQVVKKTRTSTGPTVRVVTSGIAAVFLRQCVALAALYFLCVFSSLTAVHCAYY